MRWVVFLVACSSSAPTPPPKPIVASHTVPSDAGTDHRKWLAGDLHMHVAPPDSDDVTASVADIDKAAAAQNMDFVVLTPHLWDSQWARDGATFRGMWRKFAGEARAVKDVTLIPGIEWTTSRGHFVVTGTDISAIHSRDLLTAAHAAGAFISVNHPFAVPMHVPNVPISDFNMSYRVWSEGATGFTAIDGAEVFNVPLALANLLVKPGGKTNEESAFIEMNRVVHEEHRPMTAVGGTDDHHGHALATTWVFADTTEASILAALRAGQTCVGGPEAGSFRAKGNDDSWVTIGGDVIAQTITLAWNGVAELFIDGIDSGEHADGYIAQTGGELHTYRIVVGRSRSGFIYANL